MVTEDTDTAEFGDELHGALLSANQRLKDSGGNLVIISSLVGIVISVALNTQMMDRLTGINFAELRHWYVYLLIVSIGFYGGGMLSNMLEKLVYKQHRSEILRLAQEDDLNRYQLIATIDDDYELQNIVEWLKKDVSDKLGSTRGKV